MNIRRILPYGTEEELIYVMALLKEMIIDVDNLLQDYSISEEEVARLKLLKQKAKRFLAKYKVIEKVRKKIKRELSVSKNVEFTMQYKHFPENASKTFETLKAELEECFSLEDEIANTTIKKIWKNVTNKEYSYKKGENFYHVVHSGKIDGVILPGALQYRQYIWENSTYLSCSLLTGKHMDMYHSNVGIEFDVDEESFVCATKQNCAIFENNLVTIQTICNSKLKSDFIDTFVGVGNNLKNIVVTRLVTPKAIETYCVAEAKKSYNGTLGIDYNGELTNNKIINEVALAKRYLKPKNVFIKTNGCEFLFEEYFRAKNMSETYQIPIKIINASRYRKKAKYEPFSKSEIELFEEQCEKYLRFLDGNEITKGILENGCKVEYKNRFLPTYSLEETIEFLENYKIDVISKVGYDRKIKEKMKNVVISLLNFAKEELTKEKTKKKSKTRSCKNKNSKGE